MYGRAQLRALGTARVRLVVTRRWLSNARSAASSSAASLDDLLAKSMSAAPRGAAFAHSAGSVIRVDRGMATVKGVPAATIGSLLEFSGDHGQKVRGLVSCVLVEL